MATVGVQPQSHGGQLAIVPVMVGGVHDEGCVQPLDGGSQPGGGPMPLPFIAGSVAGSHADGAVISTTRGFAALIELIPSEAEWPRSTKAGFPPAPFVPFGWAKPSPSARLQIGQAVDRRRLAQRHRGRVGRPARAEGGHLVGAALERGEGVGHDRRGGVTVRDEPPSAVSARSAPAAVRAAAADEPPEPLPPLPGRALRGPLP